MQWVSGSLISHLLVASFVGLCWAAISIWLLQVRDPRHRTVLYAGAVLAPVVGGLAHVTLPHECSGSAATGQWSHIACLTGSWIGDAGVFILASGLIAGLAQVVIVLYAQSRLLTGSKRAAELAPQSLVAQIVADLSRRFGLRTPRVHLTHKAGVCSVVGLLNPTIVMSKDLAKELDEQELRAVLAHEIAHISRQDNRIGFVIGVVRALAFFSPAVHLALTRYMGEREKAADDLAVAVTGDQYALASGVLKAIGFGGEGALAFGTGALGSDVVERVERLLDHREDLRFSRLPALMLSGAGVFLLILRLC